MEPALEMATEPDAGSADAVSRFVTVAVAGMRLAVPLAAIAEIIRPLELVPIPLAPPSLLGLARRRGAVMPVIGLARLLDLPEEAGGEIGRLVVVRHLGQPVALAVDRMAGVLDVPPDRVVPIGGDGGGDVADDGDGPPIDPALLAGMVWAEDGAAVPLLDAAAAIEREFRELGRGAGPGQDFGPAAAAAAAADGPAKVDADVRRLVCFDVAGQEFALPVERVQEVVPLTDRVTRVPRSRPHLLGIAALRGGLLPLVGLSELFGLDAGREERRRRVVVVRTEGDGPPVGVVVDAMREILRVDAALVGPVPPLLARDAAFEDVAGIARLEGGRRLVPVLSAERMFRHGAALGAMADGEEKAMADPDGRRDERAEAHVVFRMAGAEYALPVEAVREVIRPPDALTPLPNAPDFVEGIMTVRGSVLPVLSPRRLLRLAGEDARDGRRRIVTVAAGESRIGLLVDGVTGILRIPASAIGPAPTVSQAQARLIGRVAALDDRRRMVLLLDPAQLLDLERLAGLTAAAQAAEPAGVT